MNQGASWLLLLSSVSLSDMLLLIENEDYDIEDGQMVLTAQYHLRRGYCCGNGCRHCPYAQADVPENRKFEDEETKATK